MSKKYIVNIFVSQLNEMCDETCKVFNTDKSIYYAKEAIYAFSLINPRRTIKMWKVYVSDNYRDQIENKDYTFFINKDYSKDIVYLPYQDNIINKLNEVREFVSNMDEPNKLKALKYVENLTKLCDLYFK